MLHILLVIIISQSWLHFFIVSITSFKWAPPLHFLIFLFIINNVIFYFTFNRNAIYFMRYFYFIFFDVDHRLRHKLLQSAGHRNTYWAADAIIYELSTLIGSEHFLNFHFIDALWGSLSRRPHICQLIINISYFFFKLDGIWYIS